MLKHIVFGSSLAAGAAGAVGFWKGTQTDSGDKQPNEAKSKQLDKILRGVVLVLDMEGVSLTEKGGRDKIELMQLSQTVELSPGKLDQIQLAKIVEALHHAGTNPKVRGLITCTGDDQSLGPAQVQELRNAVFDFRKLKQDGVPTVAFSESFGEGGGSATLQYYLASAFEQIYVPEDGHVSFPGFTETGFFASRLLAKWGIKADVFAVGKYKDFVTPALDVKFNKASKEATMGYLTSWKDQLVEDIAADRGLSPQQVTAAMHLSPLTTAEAVSAGLITGARWRLDAVHFIRHFPDAQQPSIRYNMPLDYSAWTAAVRNGTVEKFLAEAQAYAEADGQLHNGARTHESMRQERFHEWLCLIDHLPESAAVTEGPTLLRVSDYIAYMQHAADQEAEREMQAAKEVSKEAHVDKVISAITAKPNKPNPAAAGRADQAVLGAAEEAKNKRASPLISETVTVAAGSKQAISSAGRIVSGPAAATFAGVRLPLPLIGSKELCLQLRIARNDDRVAAVVLRLDTPGGSALGSAAIYDEMMRYHRVGKPIVVSMGNYATSGGYYIAAGADKIVAQPGSLTGSIGVGGGKINIAEPLKRWGIDVETLAVGDNAAADSMVTSMTKQQRDKTQKDMQQTYNRFIARVAAGRNMSEADVRKVAQGRVWTGRDAMKHGLVDSMGGLTEAIAEARRLAGLTELLQDSSRIYEGIYHPYEGDFEYKPLHRFSDLDRPISKHAMAA